jgi:hypothetical protein
VVELLETSVLFLSLPLETLVTASLFNREATPPAELALEELLLEVRTLFLPDMSPEFSPSLPTPLPGC